MKFLLNLCSFTTELYLLIILSNCIRYIYCKIRKYNFKWFFICDYLEESFPRSSSTTIEVLSVIFMVGIYNCIMLRFFTNTQIGDLYEKNEYKEQYYINLFYSRDDVKNYRLPANIYSCLERYEYDDGSIETSRVYYLETIYWPNGNTLDFRGFDLPELEVNKKTYVSYNDETYYIELTTNKVK